MTISLPASNIIRMITVPSYEFGWWFAVSVSALTRTHAIVKVCPTGRMVVRWSVNDKWRGEYLHLCVEVSFIKFFSSFFFDGEVKDKDKVVSETWDGKKEKKISTKFENKKIYFRNVAKHSLNFLIRERKKNIDKKSPHSHSLKLVTNISWFNIALQL